MKFWMVVGLLFVAGLGFSESLKLSLKTGNLAVSAGGGKAYVLITVQATSANIQNRSPINLSLVLDRSGSMAGKKLSSVKQACIHGIEMLDEQQDRVSLVIYDDQVKTLYPNGPVRKKKLKSLIEKIDDRGSTDLNGGMQEGIAQALKQNNKQFVSRVLLLSDGLANEGETDPEKIARNARLGYEKGLTISTFGVGADYNENLMVAIARQGHGNYYFIESPRQINSIFEKEFASILSVVAKGIRLQLTPSDGVQILRIVGFDEQKNLIDVNPLYSGAETSFLLEVQVPAARSKSKISVVKVALSYEDTLAKKQQSTSGIVDLNYQKGKVNVLKDKKVYSAFVNLSLADRLKETALYLDQGKNKKALKGVKDEIENLKVANQALKDPELEKEIQSLQRQKKQIEQLGKQSYRQSYGGKVLKKAMQQRMYDKSSK